MSAVGGHAPVLRTFGRCARRRPLGPARTAAGVVLLVVAGLIVPPVVVAAANWLAARPLVWLGVMAPAWLMFLTWAARTARREGW
jgi:hypothetical protein